MNNLRALLAVVGLTVVIGGVAYQLVNVRPGVTRADLLDAGINDFCDPVQISCQVRQFCLPNRPRYGTVKKLAYQCNRDGGPTALIALWPKVGNQDCFEVAGPPDAGCLVTGPSFDDGGDPTVTQVDQDRCACRPTDGGVCRTPNPDGGTGLLMDFGVSYRPPFAGAGCVRKVCDEMAGDQGASMPIDCQ